MKKTSVLATATAVACAAGICCAASPAVADTTVPTGAESQTSTALPFTRFGDMVVDSQAGYVFVSGGASGTSIDVLNLAGQQVGEVTGQQGALGLALSADGRTLYAADTGTDSISVIDTATLKQTASYATFNSSTPEYLALMGGSLWFTTDNTDIEVVDLATGVASQSGQFAPYVAAKLITSPFAPNTLVAGVPSMSNAEIEVYTLESGTLTVTAATGQLDSSDECADLTGMAITADGKSLVVACNNLTYGLEVSLSGLANEAQYNLGYTAAGVAVSATGQIVLGENGQAFTAPNAFVFDEGNSTSLGEFTMPTNTSTGQVDDLAPLVWGTNDGTFYAIEANYSLSAPFTLITTHAVTSINLSAPVVHPNTPFTVTGTVLDGDEPAPGTKVTVSRTELGTTTTVGTFTTGSAGTFSFTETLPEAGLQVSYLASLDGYSPYLDATTTVQPIPVKYPVAPHPVPTPVKAVRAVVRR